MARSLGDLLWRVTEWGGVRRTGSPRAPAGEARRALRKGLSRGAPSEEGAQGAGAGGAGAAVCARPGARRSLVVGAGPAVARPRGRAAGHRSVLLLLLVAGTSAMMPPRVVSSTSPEAGAVAASHPSMGARLSCDAGGPESKRDISSALRSPYSVVLSTPICTGPGPAAAEAQDNSLRLRGGDEGGTGVDVAKSASYKEVAAKGVPLNGDGASTAGDEEDEEGGAGGGGSIGENALVLEVDELKLEALRKLGQSLRVGGRGTARRKFKAVRKGMGKMDDVKFQNALRKVGLNPVSEIESVEVFKADGTVWSFRNPRLLGNAQANQFCIQGSYSEHKAPTPTEAQLAAQAFDQLSDIEKLRQLAAAEGPKGDARDVDDASPKGSPEDVLAAEEEEHGDGEVKPEEKESPEELLAAEEADDAGGGEEHPADGSEEDQEQDLEGEAAA